MRENLDRGDSEDAALAARLRRVLMVNAACGDLGETTLARFMDAIDAAEGLPATARRKGVAA